MDKTAAIYIKMNTAKDTDTKICSLCHKILILDLYCVNRASKDGHSNICRSCSSIKMKLYREKNKDKLNEYTRQWREHNPNYIRPNAQQAYEKKKSEMKRRYHEDGEYKEKIKNRTKQYRENNIDKIRESNKKQREKNATQLREYARKYVARRAKEEPTFHQKLLDYKRVYRTRYWRKTELGTGYIRKVNHRELSSEWLINCKSWQEDRCYICNKKEKLTIEHLIPRSYGAPTIPQNIVYSCETCNYSRQNKILHLEWNPQHIEDLNKFTVTYSTILTSLQNAEIHVNTSSNNMFFDLRGKKADHKLYIISTFACSDRNPSSFKGRAISYLQKEDPNGIFILDREWYSRKNAVINMLKSKLGIAHKEFGARELHVTEIDALKASIFMESMHVMGKHPQSSIRVGLIYDDVLYGLGLFTNYDNFYECDRLAFNGHVPGGMSKIMKFVKTTYGNKPIISYIDSRYAVGDGHESIGFKLIGEIPETYLWVFPDRIQHQRYLSNDNKVSRNLLYFNPEYSREDNIKANGIHKIWIPPKAKFVL